MWSAKIKQKEALFFSLKTLEVSSQPSIFLKGSWYRLAVLQRSISICSSLYTTSASLVSAARNWIHEWRTDQKTNYAVTVNFRSKASAVHAASLVPASGNCSLVLLSTCKGHPLNNSFAPPSYTTIDFFQVLFCHGLTMYQSVTK